MYVTKDEVKGLIEEKLGKDKVQLYLLDEVYNLPSEETVAEILRTDLTNLEAYTSNLNDCENFAISVMKAFSGYCYGLALVVQKTGSPLHAVNVYINDERQVKFVEPQTDEEYTNYSKVIMILIG